MIKTYEELYSRLEKAFNSDNLTVDMNVVKTIVENNGTKADGNIYDIIETLHDFCTPSDEITTLIHTLHSIA